MINFWKAAFQFFDSFTPKTFNWTAQRLPFQPWGRKSPIIIWKVFCKYMLLKVINSYKKPDSGRFDRKKATLKKRTPFLKQAYRNRSTCWAPHSVSRLLRSILTRKKGQLAIDILVEEMWLNFIYFPHNNVRKNGEKFHFILSIRLCFHILSWWTCYIRSCQSDKVYLQALSY